MKIKVKCLGLMLAVLCLVVFSVPVVSAEVKININTATAEQLVQLKGVGAKYAAAIIAYRQAEGSFEKSEDITRVKGIGNKIYEANKDILVVTEDDQ